MCPTLVAFHAHPDDESVLTAGTMARAAADGHRVVLVLATDGGLGQPARATTDEWQLGSIRLAEVSRSADILGVARLCYLGYADSGPGPVTSPDSLGRTRFTRAPLEEAARRLAAILLEEDAEVLLSYDRAGGYGHPDHVRVHQVAGRAAELAGTSRVLEATAPRHPLFRILALLTTVIRRTFTAPGSAASQAVPARIRLRSAPAGRSPIASRSAATRFGNGPACARTAARPRRDVAPTASWRWPH